MREYSLLFMAGSYWIIFRDPGDEGWTFRSGTHSLHRDEVLDIIEGLNMREAAKQ